MIDPKDWKQTLSDAFHPPGFFRSVVESVVGKDISKHRTYEKAIPSLRWPLWGTAFEDMTAAGASEFERLRVFGDDWHRESAPSYQMVPVSLTKERAVMSDGGSVIQYKDAKGKTDKFVLRVFRVPRATVVNAIARDDQQENVERFFSAMSAWISKNNFFRKAKVDAFGKFLDLSSVSEEDLILPVQQKKDIFFNVKSMVEKYADYQRHGIPAKRGLILAGVPGTGKTLLAKVLAKQVDCSFIWVTPKHVMEMDGFSQIYDFAREIGPSIVLLEDADTFAVDRRINGFSPLLGELLQCLDGLVLNNGVTTLLTSNYSEVLDSALTNRPGRFDVKFRIDPPGPNEAFEMIRRTMEKRQVVWGGSPNELKSIGSMLADSQASGAYVVEAINYASMLAVERGRGAGSRLRVNPEDMRDAVTRVMAGLKSAMDAEKALGEEGLFKWGGWTEKMQNEE